MLTEVTTTFNLSDYIGGNYDPRRTKVYLTTNAEKNRISDKSTGEIRLGGGTVTLAADGAVSATTWAPGPDANPASWQTTFHIDYVDSGTRQRQTVAIGPFTITTSGLLTALDVEQTVPATYLTTVTQQLDTKVTAAETARAGAETARDEAVNISGISTSDDVVETLIKPGVAGPKTKAALSASSALVADERIAAAATHGLRAFRGMAPCADHVALGKEFASNGTDTTAMTRSKHTLTQAISQISVVFAGFYWYEPSTLAETANYSTLTIRASAETSTGTVVPLFFNGKRDGVLEPDGMLQSDPAGFEGVAGASIFIRTYVTTASGGKWPMTSIISNTARSGEGYETGTAVTDKTLAGTVATAETRGFAPSLILGGATTKRVVAVVGDSISEGNNDILTAQGGTKDIGYATRAFRAAGIAHHKIAANGGDKPSKFRQWTESRRRRNALLGCTDALYMMGANDFRNGVSTATVQADTIALWTWLAAQGMSVRACTVTPKATSTDAFATVGSQTTDTYNGNRVAFNNWLRDGAPILGGAAAATGSSATGTLRAGDDGHPIDGYFETADAVETVRDSGLWKVTGYTSDGLHPNTGGHIALAAAIDTSVYS